MRLEFKHDEDLHVLEVKQDGDGYRVSVDGDQQDLEVLALNRGELDLRLGSRRYRAYVASRGDERYVFIDGRVFTFRVPVAEDTDSDAGQVNPLVASKMPGTVVKLLVEVGQRVETGDGLLIMESMKMESEIAAPLDGTVVGIHVTAGQTVGLEVPLVDLEPAETS